MSADGGAVAAAGELTEALRAEIEEEMKEKEVDFFASEFGDVGAVFVAEKLRGNTVLEFLSLHTCGFGAVGSRALAEALAEDDTILKSLNFIDNKVGDYGADSMAQMLRGNTTLVALALQYCGVGARGARVLGEGLKDNTTLKDLLLAGNDIGNDGAESLAKALRWNESLEYLALPRCQLTDVGASSLLSALRESNSSLKQLSLPGNDGIKDKTIIHSIQELLEENVAGVPAAERRARCLLFCCLQLAPTAHEHVVPSIGAVPVPVMQYAVEHAGELHVAKRFEVGDIAVRESSAGVRDRSS